MAKKVTLPIGDKLIFESLAEIAYSVETNPPKNKTEFIQTVSDELGKEAFLHSYTPSGEIGSNPYNSNLSFFDLFDEIFSMRDGIIAVNMAGMKKAKVKSSIRQTKSSIVNLIKVYTDIIDEQEKSYEKRHGKLRSIQKQYFNMFVATIFMKSIGMLFAIEPDDIYKILKKKGVLNSSGALSDKKKKLFVSDIKDSFFIEIKSK